MYEFGAKVSVALTNREVGGRQQSNAGNPYDGQTVTPALDPGRTPHRRPPRALLPGPRLSRTSVSGDTAVFVAVEVPWRASAYSDYGVHSFAENLQLFYGEELSADKT